LIVDLRHLRYFVAVADAGGFSKAAARLRMSQPALWRQVRQLEQDLDVRLFDRIGRRVRVTGQGEDLLAQGRDLLARAESLGERARASGAGHTGVLRLGATPQTLESLASFLARWSRSSPGVSLQLIEDGGTQLEDRLEAGELHLALTRAGDPRFRGRLLFPNRLLAVIPTRHRLARRRTVEVTELVGEALLLPRQGFTSREWFDAACRAVHAHPRGLLESGAPNSLVALAREGLGIAVVPSTVRVPRVRVRPVPILHAGASLGRWVAANWDPRRFLAPYAERFVESLAAYTARHVGQEFPQAPRIPLPPAARD
jgi:LysR family transcriptional regulator, cyn operon transcriptional activator